MGLNRTELDLQKSHNRFNILLHSQKLLENITVTNVVNEARIDSTGRPTIDYIGTVENVLEIDHK